MVLNEDYSPIISIHDYLMDFRLFTTPKSAMTRKTLCKLHTTSNACLINVVDVVVYITICLQKSDGSRTRPNSRYAKISGATHKLGGKTARLFKPKINQKLSRRYLVPILCLSLDLHKFSITVAYENS